MIESVSNLFGFSTTIANARASAIGLSLLRERICLAFTLSFGYGEYVSKSIYQQIKVGGIDNLSAVQNGSVYDTIEQKVYAIFDSNYQNISPDNKKIFALVTNAILFAYYTYNDLSLDSIRGLIGSVLYNTANNVTGTSDFQPDGKGNIGHPFSNKVIQSFLQENYLNPITLIAHSPKETSIEVANYNWMEVEDIFAKPNLGLMKDIENQYYYLSGRLSYTEVGSDMPDCIPVPVTINTTGGQTTFNYYLQEPCVDRSTYIGPVTGVDFYRVFNDGPYSSGDFNDNVKQAYIQFDKNILPTGAYSSNGKILYSFLTGSDSGYLPISYSPVFTDANGQYNINAEYVNLPESYSCSHTYSGTMHIGNNAPKIVCDRDEHNQCINCRPVDMTGFKFASLQLNKDIWGKGFAYIKTNPVGTVDDILKRALNILPYSYISSLGAGTFFTTDSFGNRYLGYPQISGQNALPNIAFFQDFDNQTFGKRASISMYPSIGTSFNGTDADSDRNYQISPLNIFSGASTTSVPLGLSGYRLIKFKNNINSSGLSNDLVAQQFFGMGDNFNNEFNSIETEAYNAGFKYSGFYINNSGVYTNIIFANVPYENSVLGSPVDSINFVSGYQSDVGAQYLIKKIYAQDSGANLVAYYNIKNEDLPPALQINETQTYTFTPLPSILENQEFLFRVTGNQTVENYLPRYASGAFATIKQNFLYPNGQSAVDTYSARTNGFPLRINFILNIREEAIRELYGRFSISDNGLISTNPKYLSVIRPSVNNDIDFSVITPIMNQIFVPNNPIYNNTYDFNTFDMDNGFENSAALNMVDNNWSPYVDRSFYQDVSGNLIKNFYSTNRLPNSPNSYFLPSGKSSSYAEDGGNPFFQGVRLTGKGALQHVWFKTTGNDYSNVIYDENPYVNGLFHYYKPLQISGYILYTPPYFDLSSGSGYVNDAIKEAFSVMVNHSSNFGPINCRSSFDTNCSTPQDSFVQYVSGQTGQVHEGVDPIFLEYMGGRSGGFLVQEEGGYHSKGLIGDRWNNFSFQAYGMLGGEQFKPCGNPTRWAANDNKLVLISSTPNETQIFTRALALNPFVVNQIPYLPFNGTESYPCSIGGASSTLVPSFVSGFGRVDLSTKMPYKTMTSDGWYDETGLILGPFDRDMELGVLAGDMLYGSNANLYCNNNQITDVSGFGGCDINSQFYDRNGLDSGIVPNEYGRSDTFTIFAVVGKGNKISLNMSGVNTGRRFGFRNLTGVSGVSLRNTWLTLRPRKMMGASTYDNRLHKGEQTWISPFSFLNNGLEKKYSISTSKFEDLSSSIFNVTTYSQSGKLYPIPYSDFTGLAKIDDNGNFVYPPTATVENYWKKYAITNGQTIIVSGYREGSRLSFQFSNISVEYDAIPYQTQKIVIPSGECIVSGEMGYLEQADASVYTAGVVLKDNTPSEQNEFNDYIPSFSSDVLNRLPWITGISGKYPNPILPAPSVMIQRHFTGVVSGNQEYDKLLNFSPYNYNRLNWTALSDLETLNAGETLEAILPNDPITFNNSNIIFSASQGQPLPNGKNNPDINQTYDVVEAYQTYDSIATDALVNSGKCITTGYGTQNRLEQKSSLSGVIAPLGITLSMIKNGFI